MSGFSRPTVCQRAGCRATAERGRRVEGAGGGSGSEQRRGEEGRAGGGGEANRYLCGLTDGVPAGQTDELLLLHVNRRGVNADLLLILPQG